MANRECNLTKRIRLADGTTRFCPVVLSHNGRFKPDWVIVDGRQEQHSEGNYYLDWYEGALFSLFAIKLRGKFHLLVGWE